MFPRALIENGLGAEAVEAVLGAGGDAPVSVEQVREIARRSRRRFWLDGDWGRERPLAVSEVTSRRLSAFEALELIGPIGIGQVRDNSTFSVEWRERGWGRAP